MKKYFLWGFLVLIVVGILLQLLQIEKDTPIKVFAIMVYFATGWISALLVVAPPKPAEGQRFTDVLIHQALKVNLPFAAILVILFSIADQRFSGGIGSPELWNTFNSFLFASGISTGIWFILKRLEQADELEKANAVKEKKE